MNWLEERHNNSNKTIEILKNIKRKHPEYSKEVNRLLKDIESPEHFDYDDECVKNKIKNIIGQIEKDFIKQRNIYMNILKELTINPEKSEQKTMPIDEDICFPEEFVFKKYNGFYYFKLPKLAEKSFGSQNVLDSFVDVFIRDSIINGIEKYKVNRDFLPKYQTFTFVFVHHFLPEKGDIYDTDNISLKKPIDGVNGYLIENDTVKRSHIIQLTVEDLEEYTEMYLIEGHNLGKSILNIIEKNKAKNS